MIKGWQTEEPDFRFTPVVIGSTVGVSRRVQHEQDPELRPKLTGGSPVVEFSVRAISEAEDLGRFLAELVMR